MLLCFGILTEFVIIATKYCLSHGNYVSVVFIYLAQKKSLEKNIPGENFLRSV